MNLILTSYVATHPDEVDARIVSGVETALDAAGERIGTDEPKVSTDHVTAGVQVRTNVVPLDGSTVEWSGDDRLTEIRVVIPWRNHGETRERCTLAAGRFASVLTDQLAA